MSKFLDTENILNTLDKLGLYENLRPVTEDQVPEGREILKCFEGQITLNNKVINIQIGFDSYFPHRKPIYFIRPFNKLGFIPHVESDGYICYMQDEGSIINSRNIEGILFETLEKVKSTLLKGFNKENTWDFVNEFEIYWNRLNPDLNIYSLINHNDVTKRVITIKDNNGKVFAGDKTEEIINFLIKSGNPINKSESSSAIFIPLKPETLLIPPEYNTFWDYKAFYNHFITNISDTNRKILQKLCRERKSLEESVILKLPQKNGNFALFGIKFLSYQKPVLHPLINKFSNCQIKPIEIKRHDKRLIIPRGGGDFNLNNKKIIIVGCGSIGGTIALELAKSGVTNITLVDKDILSISNIYRNTLGNNKVDKYKVLALKEEIENKLPYTEITPIAKNIESVIKTEEINFSDYELVIVATGNPTINLYLNNYIKSNFSKLPVIYTWLEPYGIGGHTLLTNNNYQAGCYECLYSNSSEDFYNRAAFAEKDQFFAKSISGCGSLYTPYGSLDSLQTAINTVQLALDVLHKKETDNPLLSWKGDSSNFISANFKLSKRYIHQGSKELFDNRYLYKNPKCNICKQAQVS